ncbi:MAG: hypothetical protein LM573_03240 [Thermofilum sp.]|nr:hypothetical protein [Thermofilum sp.]
MSDGEVRVWRFEDLVGAGAGRDEVRVLEERMRGLEELFREEFYKRADRFWAGALKLYVDNVIDVFKLQDWFGELHDVVSFSPYFEIDLRYLDVLSGRSNGQVEGVRPTILGYYDVFRLSFVSSVDIDFVDAVVLFTGDSTNKMKGFIILDFREARVWRFDGLDGAGAGRDEVRVLEEKMKEVKEFFREEFYKRLNKFWPGALKLYVDNVIDFFGLQDWFGEVHDVVYSRPYFMVELRYFKEMTRRFGERVEGITPAWLGYFSVLRLCFAYRVCIEFTDAVALFAGDSVRKRAGYVVLDFREARVWRSGDP